LERRTAPIDLSRSQIEAAVGLYAGAEAVQSYELLQTGRANTNYLIATSQRQLVLRLHVRDAKSCAKERALHDLLEDSVPLAPLLGSCENAELLGHPFSLLALVEGATLERALRGGAEIRLETAARSLGDALARLTQFRFETFGDLVAEPGASKLKVAPWSAADFYRQTLFESPASARLGPLRDRVWHLVQTAAERFPDAWPPHLTHGDFNPTNLLVDDNGEVSAILDWEFAHAGSIWADLGNLLRTRPDCPLPPYFVPALLESLSDLGLNLPENWNALRLLADLSSAVEFLSSVDDRPETHAAALRQIHSTLKTLGQ
jgi:aminoglycoside phosphotransferase (APT) family kinase protein